MITKQILIIVTCAIWLWTLGDSSLFASTSELEHLLKTRKKIIDDLNHYIEKEEYRISILSRHLSNFKNKQDNASSYVQNPVNSFTLIKRLTIDLDDIELMINLGKVHNNESIFRHENLKYPTMEDLTEAVTALARVQDTYKLTAGELAGLYDNSLQSISQLSIDDCYLMSHILFDEGAIKHAIEWLLEALRKYEEGDRADWFTNIEIMEFISDCYFELDDFGNALKWTSKILTLNPWHERAHIIRNYCVWEENARCYPYEKETDEETDLQSMNSTMYLEKYRALCRAEREISQEVSKKLFCRYEYDSHPFLKIAPSKVEMLYVQPNIYFLHDVITEKEMRHFKTAAMARLERAYTLMRKDESLNQLRISKGAWFSDEDSPVAARLSLRLSRMTGLGMTWAESFQAINYGIGGHYIPHHDFIGKTVAGNDRIATVLMYMSNVTKGGATVFQDLDLTVFPVAGSALYWWNLHPSGVGIDATLHGACPVLLGSKWVLSKWIREKGQKLHCDLE